MQNKLVYFNGLNGVRFLAACFEIFFHTEHMKLIYGLSNLYGSRTIAIGDLGVNLFFVLSGFLITYILLVEHKQTGSINIKKFYVRRTLRIWPLYYLITLLSFFIIPYFLKTPFFSVFDNNYNNNLLMYLFFIPNVAITIYPAVPFAAQMWGVGLEEQFYLLWPVLMRVFIKKMWLFLIYTIAVIIALRILIAIIINYHFFEISFLNYTNSCDPFPFILRFDCLSIGGIGGYITFSKKERIMRILFNKYFQMGTWLILLYSIITGMKDSVFYHDIYSVLSLIIIMNIALNTKSVIKLENRILKYLGKLSYGLYTYHPLCIIISLTLLKPSYFINPLLFNCVLYLSVTLISIGLSAISYHFFEQPFLNLKKTFSIISTGDNIK